MKSRDFCYWLQGFFELASTETSPMLDDRRVNLIKQHLAMVFKEEIDPSFGGKEKQEALSSLHQASSGKPDVLLRC